MGPPQPPGLYQPSHLIMAAVIRPEITPARMLSTRLSILLGAAAGFFRRRFFVPMLTTPFLIIIIYLCEYICKMEYCTNILV